MVEINRWDQRFYCERNTMTVYNIRPIKESEYPLLEQFLYEALHVTPGYEPFA